MSEERPASVVVVVLNDLIFETKIRSTAQALGIETVVTRTVDSLLAALQRRPTSLLLVDLNTSGVEAVAAGHAHIPRPRIIAYVSHVDQELAAQAKAAGADQVMPRSRFTTELPRILQSHGAPF